MSDAPLMPEAARSPGGLRIDAVPADPQPAPPPPSFMPAHRPAGRHVLAELRGLPYDVLEDEDRLRGALERSLTDAGADIQWITSGRYGENGVTVIAILAGSHAVLHSLPTHKSAFIDIFLCRPADADLALTLLTLSLCPVGVERQSVHRGGGAHLVAS